MGFLDGAVNGMVSRLVAAGFTPAEAFCLAQAAYIKEGKRAEGVPSPVLGRQDVSWEINRALELLGGFPMGVEAHRQRIILWEKIFGRGSWHEPVDPQEIYGEDRSATPYGKGFATTPRPVAVAQDEARATRTPKTVSSIANQPEQASTAQTSTKPGNYLGFGPYFAANGVYDISEKIFAPARLYSQDRVWPGYLIFAGHMIGFFDERDLWAPSITEGAPILLRVPEISGIRVSVPAGIVVDVPPGTVSEINHGGNLNLVLETINNQRMNVAFDFAGKDDDAKARLQLFISVLLHRLAGSK